MGSKLHASSETTTELSYKKSEMSVGRQKCQLDDKKNIKNVSWTSEMSVGRQSKISKMSVGRHQIRSDQTVEKNNVTEKRVTESHRYIIYSRAAQI